MKLYPSFKFQMSVLLKEIRIYYLVLVCIAVIPVLLVFALSFLGQQIGSSIISEGLTGASILLAVPAGCTAFRENFQMSLQNGVSRKTHFLAWMLSGGAFCGLLALLDEIFTFLWSLLDRLPFFSVTATALRRELFAGPDGFVGALYDVAFAFFTLLTAFAAGYFAGVAFYRLSTFGRIAAGVGCVLVPIFGPLFLKWLLKDILHLPGLWDQLVKQAARLIQLCFGGPVNWMISGLALFLLFSGLAWLLIRRAQLKKA